MKLLAEVSRAFPQTVRTSGSYSVAFDRRPEDPTTCSPGISGSSRRST